MAARSERFDSGAPAGVMLHALRWEAPGAAKLVLLHGGGANAHWWDALAPELAVYTVDADALADGEAVPAHTMAVLPGGKGAVLTSDTAARVMVIGGEPLDGPRYITWNFVSSRRERILEAGADWAAQRMGHVPGETEFIPLPGKPFGVREPDTGTTPA